MICKPAEGGDIDPTPFVDADGARYLIYKNDGNCCNLPVSIWLQGVAANGTTLVGSPTAILKPDQAWEGNLIEAPFMIKRGSYYYLFYSANHYTSSSYGIGFAMSTAISSSYTKHSGPWLAGGSSVADGTVISPGGENFTLDGAEGLWVVYHSYRDSTLTTRVISIGAVTWSLDQPQVVPTFGVTVSPAPVQ